jgi:hypothetical protein
MLFFISTGSLPVFVFRDVVQYLARARVPNVSEVYSSLVMETTHGKTHSENGEGECWWFVFSTGFCSDPRDGGLVSAPSLVVHAPKLVAINCSG